MKRLLNIRLRSCGNCWLLGEDGPELGQFIPVIWLGVLGASLASKNGTVDPGRLIVENFGALAIPCCCWYCTDRSPPTS